MWIQRLTLAMFFSVTVVEFLSKGDKWGRFAYLPHLANYAPEIFGVFGAVVVIVLGVQSRFQNIRPIYWFICIGIVLTMIAGVVVNSVDAGPIFAGIRNYLRGVPWFFLPAVYAFSDKEIRTQLKALLVIGVIQLPIAAEQRMKTGGRSSGVEVVTGDWTVGTLIDSAFLSIVLAGMICVAAALFIRKRLSLIQFLAIFTVLMIPTLINETKATLIFLPIALLMVFIYAANPGKRLKYLFGAFMVIGLFIAAYIPVYDALNSGREYSVPLTEFLTDRRRLERYFVTNDNVGTKAKEVGRVDAIVVPVYFLAKQPVDLAFGLGMGNASDSALGFQFKGRYAALLSEFLETSFSRIVLELGFVGVALMTIFIWAVYQDARYLARYDSGLKGTIAAGWIGVVAIMSMTMFYKDVTVGAAVSYLFWYFSGLIAADRMRIVNEVREHRAHAQRAAARAPIRSSWTPAQ
jgi:hypothetical protein